MTALRPNVDMILVVASIVVFQDFFNTLRVSV